MGISIFIIFVVLSIGLSQILKSKFTKYSEVKLHADLSGAEIVAKMLRDHGIEDVQITSSSRKLGDHYNPLSKTVNLSEEVYYGKNATAAAIAAHECGHAVQHANGYAFLKFRTAMVPVLSATSHYISWVILVGIFVVNSTPLPLAIGIGFFALATLFSFVTLPVEFDASRRALDWMNDRGIVTSQEYKVAQDALWWAAMTYVVAAVGSLAQLIHLISILTGRRD
ncbi:MAG: zinc metallopeptidase [Cytophagales bacterium]|nr:zinc metallopeptidase [Cytophagales bacterium]